MIKCIVWYIIVIVVFACGAYSMAFARLNFAASFALPLARSLPFVFQVLHWARLVLQF
jgi:hypothetical protein